VTVDRERARVIDEVRAFVDRVGGAAAASASVARS